MRPLFIVDGHEDIAMALLEHAGRDFALPAPEGQALSLPDLKRGGVGLVLGTIFAPEGYWKGTTALESAKRQLRIYEELLERHQQDIFLVESRGDLELCLPGGPIGVVHLMEGADPITSPDALAWWVERGVRVVGPAWNTANRYAGGANGDAGLTPAGRALLGRMRELRVVVDVSHLNRRALDDVLDEDPDLIVASHSNAHAVYPHRRNLTDEHVRAIADRDGLVGVVLYGPFLQKGKASLADVVAHIDHLVEVAGAEHVGLGSDLDGGFGTEQAPGGIRTVADLPRIADALRAQGYAEKDVRAILGGNWLRLLQEALPE